MLFQKAIVSRWVFAACGLILLSSLNLTVQAQLDLKKNTLHFQNVTSTHINQTVAEATGNEKEVEFGDFDNDGDLDVVIANRSGAFGQRKNKMYRNDGGVFNEVSATAIIPFFSTTDVSENAFLRDFDGDGWLDLVITNDRNTGGDGGLTRYFANQHPGGVFSHFAEETSRLNGAEGPMCGGVALDLDGVNGVDLFLGNYPFSSQDTMYFNNGAGVFSDVTSSHVPTESDYTVDVAAADMNGDNKIDLLICSHYDSNFICYNHLNNAGSGLGDFKYANSRTEFPPVSGIPFMEPGDFNGDGKNDIYYSNADGTTDRFLINQGNDEDGKATFQAIDVPFPVSSSDTLRVTVEDLNQDGLVDLIVMGVGHRPYVLRNTSVNSQTSFVDWTPKTAFPDGTTHAGKHCAAFDSNGDDYKDVFIGGFSNDHLFRNAMSNELDESDLTNDTLPNLTDQDPLALSGSVSYIESDSFRANGIPAGASVSLVLRSVEDLTLIVRDGNGTVVHTVNRGGNSVEEAIQFTAPSTSHLTFEVVLNGIKGDTNGNLAVDPYDYKLFEICKGTYGTDATMCPEFDLDNDGLLGFYDDIGMKMRHQFGGKQMTFDYMLEVLVRD